MVGKLHSIATDRSYHICSQERNRDNVDTHPNFSSLPTFFLTETPAQGISPSTYRVGLPPQLSKSKRKRRGKERRGGEGRGGEKRYPL